MISLLFGRMILNQLDISEILGTAISFILLAAAFCPIPYSMFLLDLSLFNLKSSDQVSIFLAIVVAHLFTTGVGFPQKFFELASAAKKKAKKDNNVSDEENNDRSECKERGNAEQAAEEKI